MIKYIPNYKSATPDKKYRKNPETFLNNRSWKDELIKSVPKPKQPYYRGNDDLPMRYVKSKGKWFVVEDSGQGEWKEFTGKPEDIIYK